MTILVVAIHVLLALVLFWLMNWIGENSISYGYLPLSMFYKKDESPAFNFVIRVVSPTVFILISSALFYYLGLELFVNQIYLVVMYAVLLRIVIAVLSGWTRLLNWPKQVILAVSSIGFSYWVYKAVIITKSNLLPNYETISNELWMIVAIYIYSIANKIQISDEGSRKRKKNYLHHIYSAVKAKYGDIVEKEIENERLRVLVYAVLIYENFNRPKIYRFVENILFWVGKAKTLGVMQVKTERYISDRESVVLGARKLANDLNELAPIKKQELEKQQKKKFVDMADFLRGYLDESTLCAAIEKYNPSAEYVKEVYQLYRDLALEHYPLLNERLIAWEKVK